MICRQHSILLVIHLLQGLATVEVTSVCAIVNNLLIHEDHVFWYINVFSIYMMLMSMLLFTILVLRCHLHHINMMKMRSRNHIYQTGRTTCNYAWERVMDAFQCRVMPRTSMTWQKWDQSCYRYTRMISRGQ